MANGPPRYGDDPEAYRADWERWRGHMDTEVTQLHQEVGRIEKKIDKNADASAEAHKQLGAAVHKLDTKMERMLETISTRDKILGVLVAIAGVVVPLALALAR